MSPTLYLAAVALTIPWVATGSETLVEATFDTPGATVTSQGSIAKLVTRTAGSGPIDLHSPAGGGVSGEVSDRAFDNSKALDADGGGRAVSARQTLACDGFAISGWFKAAPGVLPKRQTLCIFQDQADTGIQLSVLADGELELMVNGKKTVSDPMMSSDRDWIFLGVVYDSTSEGGVARFYVGTKKTPVREVGFVPLSAGRLDIAAAPFVLGNNGSGQSPFVGWIDCFRFDSVPATAAQLETLRVDAVTP